ncbi:MAG: hypothetical protein AAFY60_20875 [Myxococcota bacterium]
MVARVSPLHLIITLTTLSDNIHTIDNNGRSRSTATKVRDEP